MTIEEVIQVIVESLQSHQHSFIAIAEINKIHNERITALEEYIKTLAQTVLSSPIHHNKAVVETGEKVLKRPYSRGITFAQPQPVRKRRKVKKTT